MSARSVALVSGCIYAPIYGLLLQSVPRKSGLGFVSRLRVHYATTDWSFWMEWTQAVFSIATVILFVADSYYWESSYVDLSMKLEVFFAVFFSFNFLFELLLSKNRWAFVMSILGIVDLVTIVPVFVALSSDPVVKSPTGFVRLYRVLMLARVFKPFRLLRAVETITPGNDAVVEQTAKTMAYFVSTLFLASGLVQVLSDGRTDEWGEVSDSTKLTFHDSLYFIIVTFSTVGYGDISPPDTQSRLAIVLLVGFFFFMIPRELNKLNHLLDLSSKYTGLYPKKLAGGHTIVGCDVASCALVASFLAEFFHEDHGYNIMHLVLLVPHEPTMEWKRLVLKFATNDRVTYLKGDLRNTTDLTRASAHTASSCFILTNRHGNLREEEKRGFMRAITVQDFNPALRIFVQAPTQEMRQRLVKVGINPTRIVCSSTINTRMLANACAWEGASTLINNLLVSASIDEQRDMPSWVKEYACGLGKEIYVVSIGAFAGRGFSDLVRELFEQHGVILLGISEDRRVVLHPGAGYIITEADLGFLVADDADVAESIVEQAVGALLPFSQAAPASPSLGPIKGFPGGGGGGSKRRLSGNSSMEGSAKAGMGSTASTAMSMTLASDARTARAAGPAARGGAGGPGYRGRGGVGGMKSPSRRSAEGSVKPEGAAEVTARENSTEYRGKGPNRVAVGGGEGGGEITPSLLALDPPSPSSPRPRDKGPDAAVPPGGPRQGSRPAAEGRSSNGEQGGVVGRVAASRTTTSAGIDATGDKEGGGSDKDGGYVVLVTPTLEQVSWLVAALEAPQVPKMGFVVVCPLYDWNQERDEEEIRRLREFSQVRLVVGPASRASLREAGSSRARMVVVRAGKSFPDQEASDADAEHIGQLVEVTAEAGPNVRAIVELNDMTYGNHYEILVDLLRNSQPRASPRSARVRPPPVPVGLTGDGGRRDTAAAIDDDEIPPRQPQHNNNNSSSDFSPRSTWESFGKFSLSVTAVAYFRRGGGEGRSRRRWWSRLFGGGGEGNPDGPLAPQGGEGSDLRGARQSAYGSTALGGAMLSQTEAAATPGRAKEGQRARVHWTLTKGVASGAIVPSSLPETLLCQAFYNPAIIMIVEALLDPEGQGHGKGEDSGHGSSTRHCGRSIEKGFVQEPKGAPDGNVDGRGGDTSGKGVGGGEARHEENQGEDRQGCALEHGEASFLAQIVPPKQFFTQAMVCGHRPNFQALMSFMLEEYDALPFGLLRHGKVESPCGRAEESPNFVHCCPDPGQKVMPLDKVFLLAPNLRSWERMQLDSPPPSCGNRCADFASGSRTGPTTPRLTPQRNDASASRSQRGFPPEPPDALTDGRGFPVLHGDRNNHCHDRCLRPATLSPSRYPRGHGGGGGGGGNGDGGGPHRGTPNHRITSLVSEPSPPDPSLPRVHRNLFLSPFSSTLPPETATLAATNKFDGNRTSWVGRFEKNGGGGDLTGGPESPPHPSPSRQAKGSHAKLDLLLHEMHRLNGRLDMIVGRIGVLEEERSKPGTGGA